MKSPTWMYRKEYTYTNQGSTPIDFIPIFMIKCPVLPTRNKAYNALSQLFTIPLLFGIGFAKIHIILKLPTIFLQKGFGVIFILSTLEIRKQMKTTNDRRLYFI